MKAKPSHPPLHESPLVLHREFTIEDGEMTATMKVRRNQVMQNFRPELYALYNLTKRLRPRLSKGVCEATSRSFPKLTLHETQPPPGGIARGVALWSIYLVVLPILVAVVVICFVMRRRLFP